MARDAAEAAAAKGNGTSSSSKAADRAEGWVDRFGASTPRKGADILVQALEREGVTVTFGYPGGASLEIHQALTRSTTVRNILCRHEQGEVFAAEGYAKTTGDVGVCIATSGPGATNLVTGLADALLDSVPLVAVTGQVPRRMIGTDAFQETPIVEVTRQITKHNYLVMDVADLPRVMREAFFLARTGRPGPVLVDVPKDVQQTLAVPDWGQRMAISGYVSRLPQPPSLESLQPVIDALRGSKKPVLYCGGGCLDASPQLREFVSRTRIPVAQTLMGLGVYPESDELALQMLGMHGTVAANAAVDGADLLVAIGVRFDDRVTGKLELFAARARIVHIDVDPAEIGKNKQAHVALTAEARPALEGINALLAASPLEGDPYAEWRAELAGVATEYPLSYPDRGDVIVPQRAIEVLHEETKGEAIVSTVSFFNFFLFSSRGGSRPEKKLSNPKKRVLTLPPPSSSSPPSLSKNQLRNKKLQGVGQHQMWAAQWYKFDEPRRWVTSGGLGAMGFGLPSALGAAAAHDGSHPGRPKRAVVDIDGDGSFVMNIQELATAYVEKLDVKVMVLNNQHLGMVVQWEDRFYKANRAHTYLGKPEAEYHQTGELEDIYPDFVGVARAFGVPSRRVVRPAELREAIREMLDTPGPFLLDVMVPHVEHVLPMIPGGGSFKDVITSGDGLDTY